MSSNDYRGNEFLQEKTRLLKSIETCFVLNVMTRANLIADVNAIQAEWSDAWERLEQARQHFESLQQPEV
jgi:hypothetical protein